MGAMAWRNLWRQRGRTLIVMTAIALTTGLMLTSFGLGDDSHDKMLEAAARTVGGDLVVHARGFWDDRDATQVIEDASQLREHALTVDGVAEAIPRVLISGLLSSARGDTGALVQGIVPDVEAALYDFRPFLVEGAFLDGDEDRPIVLGRAIVDDLAVELGDRVVLTATDADGEVTRALFRLDGVVDTGSAALDRAVAFTRLDVAQEAIHRDTALTQLGVLLEPGAVPDGVQAALRTELPAAEELEVLRWDEANTEMVAFIEIDDAFNYIFAGIVFLVVAFGIANTFLMVVMERIREFGLLGAIGMSPRRIAQLVLTETALLAFVSLLVGLGLGLLGHTIIATVGIDMRQMMGGEGLELGSVALSDPIMRSTIRPVKWAATLAIVFVLVLGSALWPALRAARLSPVDAMRTYQ